MENWRKLSFSYHQIPSLSIPLYLSTGHSEAAVLLSFNFCMVLLCQASEKVFASFSLVTIFYMLVRFYLALCHLTWWRGCWLSTVEVFLLILLVLEEICDLWLCYFLSQHSSKHCKTLYAAWSDIKQLLKLLGLWERRHNKTNNVAVCPVKTQINLGIRPVWSESSLSAWRNLGFLATHWAHSEDSDQTGRMPRLIWVFAGRTLILLVLSCCGSWQSFILLQLL